MFNTVGMTHRILWLGLDHTYLIVHRTTMRVCVWDLNFNKSWAIVHNLKSLDPTLSLQLYGQGGLKTSLHYGICNDYLKLKNISLFSLKFLNERENCSDLWFITVWQKTKFTFMTPGMAVDHFLLTTPVNKLLAQWSLSWEEQEVISMTFTKREPIPGLC